VHPILAEIFGPDLIVVIVVIVVVLFGGSQIPKLARSLGSAHSEFKKGLADGAKDSAASDTPDTGDKATTKDGEGPAAASG
jgi:sec-independent protein translocase protein TatA